MKRRISLKRTLVVGFIFVSVAPFLLTSFWVAQRVGKSMEQEAALKNSLLAQSVVAELENFVIMPVHHLEQAALLIDQAMISADKVDDFIEAFVAHDDLFDTVELINHQGIVTQIIPFDRNSIGLDMSNKAYFQESGKDRKIHWSKTFVSLQTGLPTVTLSIPFSQGYLVGHINLSVLNTVINRFTASTGGSAQITDSTGNVIAHPDRNLVLERFNSSHLPHIQQGLAGYEGTYQYTDNNTAMIASVAIAPHNGWVVAVSQPLQEVLAPAKEITLVIYTGLLVAVIIASAIALICLRLVLTPLTKFAEESKAITRGEYTSGFQTGSYLELEQVANALNTMVQALEEREATLRDEVVVRVRAEEKLKENQERLQAILDHSPALISIKNVDGDILLVNQKFEVLTGVSPEQTIGKNIFDVFPKDIAESTWAEDLAALQKGKAIETEEIVKHQDETWHTYFSVKFPLKNDEGIAWGVCAISTDITDRKKIEEEKANLEAQLSQSQKMESIGTLAGGIAHDFNNILTAIIGYTELAQMDTDNPEVLRQDLDEVLKGSLRAKELVQQILTFSRSNTLKLQPLKAQLIIKEALKLLRSSIPATIDIKQDIDLDCPPILADPSQIHQLVMNLCTNAYHAMRNSGGVLGVTARAVTIDQAEAAGKGNIEPGPYMQLEIRDTGSGISKDILGKIFDPYYTTKQKGEGTGLGLAVVHGIVSRLHGHIDVASEPGKGTTFTVHVPTIAAPRETARQEVATPLPQGHERILLVDDDSSIATLSQKILTSLGYKVTALTNSKETLQMFAGDPEAFDLVITDMTMPDMTGEELARQILRIRPGMPIIMCSGYSEIFDEEKAMSMGICSYVMKPIIIKDLAGVVRKVLDGAG